MTVSEPSTVRRLGTIEQTLRDLETMVVRMARPPGQTVPIAGRFWRYTLNEDMGATTSDEAAADLLTLDGTDTSRDITVSDVLSVYGAAQNGDGGLCVEQLDHDGTLLYVPVGSSETFKLLGRFTLGAALTTSDASKTGTLVAQYGPGTAHTDTSITLHNLLTHTAGTYVFEGDSGDAGLCMWDSSDDWRIIQMECP